PAGGRCSASLPARRKSGGSSQEHSCSPTSNTNSETNLAEITSLKKPYSAVFGKPLGQEDSVLYKKLSRLARLRNDIVHKGTPIDRSEGWSLVVAAQQLFELLDAKTDL
ncbi:hypothetical protein, partial [Pseudonocardia nigra]|uniref:hypothetical protein n=1 Tax=Pseudonocardia nigra TaxID=1921578 RepID=UPI001C5F7899